MIREAIDRILALGKPEIIDIGEGLDARKFSTGVIHAIKAPMPETLEIQSLQGLVDYIGFQKIEASTHALFVHAHDKVALRSVILHPESQRDCQIIAKLDSITQQFGQNMSTESFIVWLQSRFCASPERDKVMKLVGNITAGAEVQVQDDGVTQRATVRAGVTRQEQVDCPNPVNLRPFATFNEVEQPERPFILRIKTAGKDEPVMAALHEADGGAWQVTARANIAAWLRGKVDIPVIA